MLVVAEVDVLVSVVADRLVVVEVVVFAASMDELFVEVVVWNWWKWYWWYLGEWYWRS